LQNILQISWIIPVLPFLAFAGIGLILHRWPKLSAGLSILAIGGSFLLSVLVALKVFASDPGQVFEISVRWLSMPGLNVDMGIMIDPLTAVMLIVVTTVAMLVQIYSLGYMDKDPGFASYFAYQSIFAGSMLGLVVASNFGQIFVFWELVGMCSYLLIGFWFGKYGIFAKRNAIAILMSIELMLNAVNINFVAINKFIEPGNTVGQLFAIFIIVVAAAEVSVGLALIISIYRHKKSVNLSDFNLMKW